VQAAVESLSAALERQQRFRMAGLISLNWATTPLVSGSWKPALVRDGGASR
jgi:hypothetical protein